MKYCSFIVGPSTNISVLLVLGRVTNNNIVLGYKKIYIQLLLLLLLFITTISISNAKLLRLSLPPIVLSLRSGPPHDDNKQHISIATYVSIGLVLMVILLFSVHHYYPTILIYSNYIHNLYFTQDAYHSGLLQSRQQVVRQGTLCFRTGSLCPLSSEHFPSPYHPQ